MTPWILMPAIDCVDLTYQAVEDCLAQSSLLAPPKVLLIDNGSSVASRRAFEKLAEDSAGRVLAWFHNPPLGGPPFGTVNATWNAGLDFCWSVGAEEVLVVNNDVRLHPQTYSILRAVLRETAALFVSAVGVTEEQFEEAPKVLEHWLSGFDPGEVGRGGPDFSCFLISKDCHTRFRFDEQFTYHGDVDMHRTMMLAGEGDRIFGVNVPYLHYGSRTINRGDTSLSERYAQVFRDHQKKYEAKWGGTSNVERWNTPYSGVEPDGGACTTTPDLQRHGCSGCHRDDGTPRAHDDLVAAIRTREAAGSGVSDETADGRR